MKRAIWVSLTLGALVAFQSCKPGDNDSGSQAVSGSTKTIPIQPSDSIGRNLNCGLVAPNIGEAMSRFSSTQEAANELTRALLCVKDKDQMADLIAQIDDAKNVQDLYPNVIVKEAAKLLRPLRGIAWILRPIVEGKSDLLHMNILNYLREVKANEYVYGTHLSALFDYLMDPPPEADHKKQFQSVAELQDYLKAHYFNGAFESIIDKLDEIASRPPSYFEFKIDRSLVLGKGKVHFLRESDTVKYFVKPHHQTVLFVMKRYLAYAYYVANLDLDDLPAIVKKVVKGSGLNMVGASVRRKLSSLFPGTNKSASESLPKAITPKDIYMASDRTRFLTIRGEDLDAANRDFRRSYELLSEAASHAKWGYVCSIKYAKDKDKAPSDINESNCAALDNQDAQNWETLRVAGGRDYLFDPNKLLMDYDRNISDLRLQTMILNEGGTPHSFKSNVTGKDLTLHAAQLFTHKSRDLKSWLFPEEFHEEVSVPNSGIWQWDHRHGKIKSWRDHTFNGFIQTNLTGEDFYREILATFEYTPALQPYALLFLTRP